MGKNSLIGITRVVNNLKMAPQIDQLDNIVLVRCEHILTNLGKGLYIILAYIAFVYSARRQS